MAEKFRRNQVARDSGTIHTDKRSRGPLRPFVDRTRDQLFARAGFAGDQNRGVGRSNLGYSRQYRTKGSRSANDLLEHRCPIDLFAQRDVLVMESLLSLLAIFDIGSSDIPTREASLTAHPPN